MFRWVLRVIVLAAFLTAGCGARPNDPTTGRRHDKWSVEEATSPTSTVCKDIAGLAPDTDGCDPAASAPFLPYYDPVSGYARTDCLTEKTGWLIAADWVSISGRPPGEVAFGKMVQ